MTSVSVSPASTLRNPDIGVTVAHNRQTPAYNVMKRIIVLCDGTWQDGFSQKCTKHTNIMRLAKSINYRDDRNEIPVPQVVYYLSGVGSGNDLYSRIVDGATGISIFQKIQAGYGFIAQNYHPGDEIFLFGFSRGAYTARMIAMLIGQLGVLDRKNMNHFPDIFEIYQKLGDTQDKTEIAKLKESLFHWTNPNSSGKLRADPEGDGYTIKCLCVFDTVNSVGLPKEISLSKAEHPLFGLPDQKLGKYIERAYQALALDENRIDFNCLKFVQSDAGRRKGQLLKQCWFSGSHSDVGGGFFHHDLADLTLLWIAGQVGDILSLDMSYLGRYVEPVAPWGEQIPHDPSTGVFYVASVSPRPLPSLDASTQECVHPSVLKQGDELRPALKDYLLKHPELIHQLTPLEEEWKHEWPYNPDAPQVQHYKSKLEEARRTRQAGLDIGAAPVSTEKISKRRSLIVKLMRATGLTKEITITSVTQKTQRRVRSEA